MNSWAIRHRGDQDKPNTLKLLSIILLDIPKYIKLLFFLGTVTMWVFVQNQEPGQTGGALGAGGRGSSARRSSGTTPPGSIHRRYQGGPREGLQGESPREGSGCRMEWTGWVDWAWVLVRIGSLVMVYTNKTTHFIFFVSQDHPVSALWDSDRTPRRARRAGRAGPHRRRGRPSEARTARTSESHGSFSST